MAGSNKQENTNESNNDPCDDLSFWSGSTKEEPLKEHHPNRHGGNDDGRKAGRNILFRIGNQTIAANQQKGANNYSRSPLYFAWPLQSLPPPNR